MAKRTKELPGLSLLTIGEAATRTGVKAVTLRAWERRYGVPRPVRTVGGYRLYSHQALDEIAALQKHAALGLHARQAALLVRYGRANDTATSPDVRVRHWRQRLTRACVRFDDVVTNQVVVDASESVGAFAALNDVVLPVVALLGDAWHDGVINVSQEHYASQVARRVALSLLAPATGEAGRRVTMVSGCAPKEQHELGLLSLLCALQRQGHSAVHLGCDVPVDGFLATIEALRPRVAVVAVTLTRHLKPWRDAFRRGSRFPRGTTFVWAGPGAPRDLDGLRGLTARTMAEAIDVTNRTLRARLPAAQHA